MVHVVLKNRLRANLQSPRDCAAHCGVAYGTLMNKLNGFSPLSPELERKIIEFIESGSRNISQPSQGKITREFKGDVMTRDGR